MNDKLLDSSIKLTMRFLNDRQQSQSDKKPFYHANLLLMHFVQCKGMFAPSSQFHKTLLTYYQQRWILKDEIVIDDTDSCVFMREMKKESEVCRLTGQFVVRLLIVGLESLLSMDIEKIVVKDMRQIYGAIKLALIFESQSPTEIFLPFVQKVTEEIKSFPFYQNLLKIFKKLDNITLINFIEKKIKDYREQWNKNQQQLKDNFTTKRKNRQSVFLPSPKRNLSVKESTATKENDRPKENTRQAHKSGQKEKEPPKTDFKALMSKSKQVNSRKSFHQGKMYQFNPRQSTNDFQSSTQSQIFEEMRYNNLQPARLIQLSSTNRQQIRETEEDCFCEGTPDKKKKQLAKKNL